MTDNVRLDLSRFTWFIHNIHDRLIVVDIYLFIYLFIYFKKWQRTTSTTNMSQH